MTNGPEILPTHPLEPHNEGLASRLNWLRAGVLGANDGIVSVAGIVVGVAAAAASRGAIATAGLAGLVAGATSMALGEYVSVSTQRDTERALLAKERRELDEEPDFELAELVALYQGKGLSPKTAQLVAKELTAHDAFAAHVEAELGIDPKDLANPWQAALSSAVSFVSGAALPIVAVLVPPVSIRVPVTIAAVLLALALTGSVSARLGGARRRRAVARIIVGGALAMAFTYAVGRLAGVSGL